MKRPMNQQFIFRKGPLRLWLLLWSLTGACNAQSPAEQQASCEQAAQAQLYAHLADFGRYASSNAALAPPGPKERRVVFMGDSITEGWAELDPDFLAHTNFIDRGISGQTTMQMLLRFRADVIALKPAVV